MLGVDRETLRMAQQNDPTVAVLKSGTNEGVSSKNISFKVRNGFLYRKYRDRRGQSCDQLVVPAPYRRDLLSLCHEHSWAGHLGINKTKKRLLQEFYWQCFSEKRRISSALVRLVKEQASLMTNGKDQWLRCPLFQSPSAELLWIWWGRCQKQKRETDTFSPYCALQQSFLRQLP